MDAFTQYDVAARRLRDLPTASETQKRLQKAVYQKATTFLHLHMLPLKSLPKILKHAAPNGLPQSRPALHSPRSSGTFSPSPLVTSIQRENGVDTASQASSSAVSALEAEERVLKEKLVVLEEQHFFIEEMLVNCQKRRKFDEVGALTESKQDLAREIDQLRGQIGQLDFAGAYGSAADGAATPKARA